MRGFDGGPDVMFFGRKAAQVFRHQFVLRIEVTIERHLVGAGGFRDRLHPDRPDAVAIEQVARHRDDPLAGRKPFGMSRLSQRSWHFVKPLPLDRGVTGQ